MIDLHLTKHQSVRTRDGVSASRGATLLLAEIPIWASIVVTMCVAGAAGVAASYFYREPVYQYRVVIPNADAAIGESEFTFGPTQSFVDPDYFRRVKASFISSGKDFIEADLSEMRLRVFEAGSLALEATILSKGKEGSWWETPAGLYRIETKEKNHFSSFGQVYQPWSLAFQGNFFIHGWPHYPDGAPVPVSYSGGCVRLSNDEAKEVYALAEVGTPVLVRSTESYPDTFTYETRGPVVSAKSYLAADIRSGFIFYDHDPGKPVPIASITKLMTALVAVENMNMANDLDVTEDAIVYTSKPRLTAGERFRAADLLYPMLMESSNEAARAIAGALGEGYFVTLMNKKAGAIGMNDASFADASGASAGNIASPTDLFKLLQTLYHNRSFILRIAGGNSSMSTYGPVAFQDLTNLNGFDGERGFVGGKLGKTNAAGETYAAVFDVPFRGVTRPIGIVVLGSTDALGDTRRILEEVKARFE